MRTKDESLASAVELLDALYNALQRIDTAAVMLPTFKPRHEGGLDAVVQNIVDAIVALHKPPAQQVPQPNAQVAAVKTLERLGYTYHGAELWKPPLGQPLTGAEIDACFENNGWSPSDMYYLVVREIEKTIGISKQGCGRMKPLDIESAFKEAHLDMDFCYDKAQGMYLDEKVNDHYRSFLAGVLSASASIFSESASDFDYFKEWMCREMPPMTVIGQPEWWAKRIYDRFIQTPPPKRTWVGLTEIEALGVYEEEQQGRWGDHVRGLLAIADKLKEKNT